MISVGIFAICQQRKKIQLILGEFGLLVVLSVVFAIHFERWSLAYDEFCRFFVAAYGFDHIASIGGRVSRFLDVVCCHFCDWD